MGDEEVVEGVHLRMEDEAERVWARESRVKSGEIHKVCEDMGRLYEERMREAVDKLEEEKKRRLTDGMDVRDVEAWFRKTLEQAKKENELEKREKMDDEFIRIERERSQRYFNKIAELREEAEQEKDEIEEKYKKRESEEKKKVRADARLIREQKLQQVKGAVDEWTTAEVQKAKSDPEYQPPEPEQEEPEPPKPKKKRQWISRWYSTPFLY